MTLASSSVRSPSSMSKAVGGVGGDGRPGGGGVPSPTLLLLVVPLAAAPAAGTEGIIVLGGKIRYGRRAGEVGTRESQRIKG